MKNQMKHLLRTLTLSLLSVMLCSSTPASANWYLNPYVHPPSATTVTSAGGWYENAGTPASSSTVYEFRTVCVSNPYTPIYPWWSSPPPLNTGVYGAWSNPRWSYDRGSLPFSAFNSYYPGTAVYPDTSFNRGYIIRLRFSSPYQLDPNHPEKCWVTAFEWWDASGQTYRDTPFHCPVGSRWVDWYIQWQSEGSAPSISMAGSGTEINPPSPSALYSLYGEGFRMDGLFGEIPGYSEIQPSCTCNEVPFGSERGTLPPMMIYDSLYGPGSYWLQVALLADSLN